MPSWVYHWKPFWIPVGESFKRPTWRSGSSSAVTLLTDTTLWISLCSTAQTTVIAFLRHPEFQNNSILFLGNPRGLKKRLIFGNELRHHCLHLRPRPKCNFIHPRQLSPFSERLELPFSHDEIMCCYEEIVSSGTDHFTAWVKMGRHEVLVQHMVDIHKATAEFREAYERKTCYIFSHEQYQQALCYPINCAEETQHLQLESWTPSCERKCFRTKKLQENGISLPCRMRPSMLTTSFSRIATT